MTTPHQPQPHTDGIPEDIMRRAAAIGHIEYLHFLPFEVRASLTEVVAACIIEERRRIASDLFNRPGFMTNNSADGKHWIEISFKTGEEAWGLYNALVDLSQWKSPSTTQPQTGRQSDV